MRMVVVFPAPFGPNSPYTSPGFTTNDNRSTAKICAPPMRNRFVNSWIVIIRVRLPGSSQYQLVCNSLATHVS